MNINKKLFDFSLALWYYVLDKAGECYFLFSIIQSIFLAVVTVVASVTNFFVSVAPVKPSDDGIHNIRYGDGVCEYYDMYLPDGLQPGDEADIIYMIHGGSWINGRQSKFDSYCESFADRGYVAVSVDYDKLQNGATALDMTDELYNAVAHIKDNLAQKGITADKMGVIGHSSGAHLALMYSYIHSEDSPVDIGFVFASSAPTDLFDDSSSTPTTMGRFKYIAASFLSGTAVLPGIKSQCEEALKSINPITYISESSPATLITHGSADTMVPYSNSMLLKDALDSAGVENTFITFEGGNHFYLDTKDDVTWNLMVDTLGHFLETYL